MAVLLIVYEDAEIGYESSVKLQFGNFFMFCALLPTAKKVRRLLSAKNKKQIEEYYQRILVIFLSSLVSVCFVIFQAIGCLSRDDDDIVEVCSADIASSFTVSLSIALLFIYEVFFNFVDVDVIMESKCSLRNTSFLTFAQTFVYGLSSCLAFSVYGMKQFVMNSIDSVGDDGYDGYERMKHFLLHFAKYSQVAICIM